MVTGTTAIAFTTAWRRTIGIVAAFALIVVSFVGWAWMTTTISDHPVPAQHVVLSGALNLYRTRHRTDPPSLVALQPALDDFTNSRCSIVRIGTDRYRVWLNLGGDRTQKFEVEYKLGKDGYREKCHVYSIRKFSHRK